MSSQWETAKHCHSALSFLLLNIQRQSGQRESESYLPFDFDSETNANSVNRQTGQDESALGGRWKRKLDSEEAENAAVRRRRSAVSVPSGSGSGSGSNNMTPPSAADSPAGDDAGSRPPPQPATREFLIPPVPRVGYPAYDTSSGSGSGTSTGNAPAAAAPDSDPLPPPPPPPPHYYSYSPLLMMNLSGLDDPQWPGGSASATNFDLNMTDLFQGSMWDLDINIGQQQQQQQQSQQ